MFKIKKSRIILIIVAVLVLGYLISYFFFKSPTTGYVTEKISKGDVLQEISETGSVKATQDISLGFKGVGKIAKVDVAVGDDVKKGDILAELDLSQVSAQLAAANAALNAAQTQYQKLLNGSTQEDVQTYQDAVNSAENDLQSAYKGGVNTINDAYTKAYNAYNAVVALQKSSFPLTDQTSLMISESKNDMSSNLQDIKNYVDKVQQDRLYENIDFAVTQILLDLDNVANDLRVIREQCDQGSYYYSVSSTDKATIDTHKGYINTASTNLTTLQNSIASYKNVLKRAQDALALKTSVARPEDIGYYASQVEQAKANVNLYQSQLNDNYLRSPIDGKVTQVNIKRGETVSPSESAINLLSLEPFQIKVDIYEQDIVNVKVGDSVKINLVAFPKQTFNGKVLSIDPAESIVDNVVYYKVTIEFPNQPDGIRSGMTADIIIEANKKENVLRVPKNAVQNIDGTETVQIIKDDKVENKTITTGLEGNDYYEVISGVEEGEEIVTGKK